MKQDVHLDLEKAEEPEIKLPTFPGSWKKQGNMRKKYISASLTTLKPWTVWITTGKFLKEIGIPDQLTCLLRKLYVDQETTVRTKHGTTDWFNIGKVVCQVCMVSPYLHYVKYRLDESQAGIKIAWRNINNLRYADDTTLMAES